MADTYWAEQERGRWDVYSKQRGWMAHADTEDDARLILAGLEALQAQQPAAAVPEGYALVPVEPLKRARDTAMEWTLRGRIPECGQFGGIAQDLDAMLAAANKENTND